MSTRETTQSGPGWEMWHDLDQPEDILPYRRGPLHLTIHGQPFAVQSGGLIVDVVLPADLAGRLEQCVTVQPGGSKT